MKRPGTDMTFRGILIATIGGTIIWVLILFFTGLLDDVIYWLFGGK